MKRNLKRLSALLVVLSLLASAGCTSGELMKARDANEQMARRFKTSEADRKALKADNDRLQRSLAARDDAGVALKQENDLYRTECANLKDQIDKLDALYNKELKRKAVLDVGTGPLPPGIDRALRSFARAYPNLMEYQSKYGMVKLKSDLSFASGSAVVQAETGQALGKLVEILKTPEALAFHVYVAGHTDDVPIGNPTTRKLHPTNWYLSVHRAIGVQKVLVRAGMPEARIGVMGFGEYHPIAPNRPNKKGNPLNRRVELWILPSNRLLTRPMGGR